MYKNTDEDDDSSDAVVPFQVAYAVSIHKAQGLEYDSVKIVISNEVEEMISHNIFYTAITRAKEKLKIYTWRLRVLWIFGLLMLWVSIYILSIYAIIHYIFLLLLLYIFGGYRICFYNTKLYPSVPIYFKLLLKYPLNGIPFSNKHLG